MVCFTAAATCGETSVDREVPMIGLRVVREEETQATKQQKQENPSASALLRTVFSRRRFFYTTFRLPIYLLSNFSTIARRAMVMFHSWKL